MAAILPNIGTTGLFTLKSPFDSQLLAGVAYTCTAIRKVEELLAMGVDPFVTYYKANNITSDIYNSDLITGLSIVTLQSVGGGHLVYVPSTFIDGYPSVGGVSYTRLGLAVDIGSLPDQMNLGLLINKVSDLVQATIGVTPKSITKVALSATTLIDNDKSVTLENARKLLIQQSETDLARANRLQATVTAQAAQIKTLEDFILSQNKT